MLTRSTQVRLALFVIITLIGVSYVSAKYVGLTKGVFGAKGCTVSAEFPDSGGIFTNAEVTYRGVAVGKVGKLNLIEDGVRVDLKLDNCNNPKIPSSAVAMVSDRSVVGEQYVNLVPPNGDAPYLLAHQVIPMSRNKLPVAAQVLLTNLDTLVKSVDVGKLQIAVDELGKTFNGRGIPLGSLLDSTNDLLTAAQQNLPQTLALIKSASTVLDTQIREGPAFASFSHSLNLLSAQFKASDTDIRSLIDNGPSDFGVLQSFVRDNKTDLGVTLANLASSGQLLVRHLDGVKQILELYPALAAGGLTVLRPDGIGHLGLVTDPENPTSQVPADCGDIHKGREGYEGTPRRLPGNLSPQAPNVSARCTAPVSSGTNIRGSANVPGGDPISTSGGGVAYPRVGTANTVNVGATSSGGGTILGDQSWIAILTDGLH